MGTISSMEKSPEGPAQGVRPGSSMDRVIEPPSRYRRWGIGIAVVFMLVVAAVWTTHQAGRSLTVSGSRIVLSPVESGVFEDTIPVRARVAPLTTVFLDAVQGGRVEEILVEDGASVVAGQPLVRLSNSDLQLSVMSTESRVMEQLNSMRDQELRL